MSSTDILKNSFKQSVFNVTPSLFNALALEIFYYQAKYNSVYAQFLQLIDTRPQSILEMADIPFMPIEFFKGHKVSCENVNGQTLFFTSSSTTGKGISRHYVPDIELYNNAIVKSFEFALGKIEDHTFRFLLPSYLEKSNSSLIHMAEYLTRISGKGGFYLNDLEKLAGDLEADKKQGSKVLLLGVSFALMDFAEKFPMDMSGIMIMETGGMKGRREEITRDELHTFLKKKWNTEYIASEYGMTELLSQAYSIKDGIFNCPPWMKIIITQTTDPFTKERMGKTGCINIIDLANINSCCFIATSDLGRIFDNGSFEVLGRYDHSDVRGCNLMVD